MLSSSSIPYCAKYFRGFKFSQTAVLKNYDFANSPYHLSKPCYMWLYNELWVWHTKTSSNTHCYTVICWSSLDVSKAMLNLIGMLVLSLQFAQRSHFVFCSRYWTWRQLFLLRAFLQILPAAYPQDVVYRCSWRSEWRAILQSVWKLVYLSKFSLK